MIRVVAPAYGWRVARALYRYVQKTKVADPWKNGKKATKDFKKDVGVELRLESFSYYAYPTRIFLSAAYGLDKFERYIRSRDQYVPYGREWRIYFGILFGFELD